MKNQNFKKEENEGRKKNAKQLPSNLQWGAHNPRLTDDNFIDRQPKKIRDQNEVLASSNAAIDLSEEEPGRNRKGVREGQNALGTNK